MTRPVPSRPGSVIRPASACSKQAKKARATTSQWLNGSGGGPEREGTGAMTGETARPGPPLWPSPAGGPSGRCAPRPTRTPGSPARASASHRSSPSGSAPAARCGPSAWSTRFPAPTPGAASRPGSGGHNTTRTRPAPATAQGGRGMTSPARPRRRQQRTMAARQALRLCEADPAPGTPGAARVAPRRVTAVTTRAALRAAGLPPQIAATLRSRLRLIPEQEAEP